ncbi:MAG TPA: hypothetical protein VK279_02395 [Solirubrobacteraceae bacterium]|nr:hypothetical protein [Solirubrobacteraceae bacterium]
MRPIASLAALAALLLALPASALAGSYPAPSDPGSGPPGSGKAGQKLSVCKRGCDYTRIQDAVNAAGRNSSIRVKAGTYKEGVIIRGARKNGISLTGSAGKPESVLLEGKGVSGGPGQNGVRIDGADDVSVRGFKAQNFKGNGFFVTNADDYSFRNLIAVKSGAYGLYAFNARGGEMLDSEAYYFSDAGTYVGQTPPQARPKRTRLAGLKMWGSAQGFSGQNMRYVTITDSDWYNNGLGLSFTSRDSEKYTPEEDNVLSGNRIFLNNFNSYVGTPVFGVPRNEFVGGFTFPVGVGLLLYGGFDNRIENNQIFGHYAGGIGMLNSLEYDPGKCSGCRPESEVLKRNTVTGNSFGNGGANPNGRDIAYTGQGVGNCIADNPGATTNLPANNSTLTCDGPTVPNTEDPSVLGDLIVAGGVTGDPTHQAGWVRLPQSPVPGITPLERQG